ncbi:hypothetical protein BABA_10546 [Neobacillus bataviensis LMG 21833]|uniref:Uncharacterized protein n=1 Tax=Neobacillus bataviensis LMG 21833 TaxID=1117379 RepID=K6CDS0_9BACI|nr:hypothetical protein [Neobacillus bataviensis]EKN69295.1 hypothetical protein BABA_10546 [Neobacillus bataviensis LMG 21833]
MAKLIKNVDGKKAYLGLLSPQEIEEANKMQEYLETFIPALEEKLNTKYKKRVVAYAYEFGTELRKLVEQFDIKGIQEKMFWDQIRDFASNDEGRPQDRGNRKLYDYYFKLSYYDLIDINNVNWSEWSYLFDVKEVMKEERIINWLAAKAKNIKISRNPFRLFMTGIRLFIKDKDTSVFEDQQLFEKYDMVYDITSAYIDLYKQSFTDQDKKPTEARLKQKKKYQEKYFKEVFLLKRKSKDYDLLFICEQAFKKIYLID